MGSFVPFTNQQLDDRMMAGVAATLASAQTHGLQPLPNNEGQTLLTDPNVPLMQISTAPTQQPPETKAIQQDPSVPNEREEFEYSCKQLAKSETGLDQLLLM